MGSFLKGRKLLLLVGMFLAFAAGARAQTCEAVPGQVLIDLFNQADLPAIATQYGLQPTPIDQEGTPPTYRMAIRPEVTQNPCQIAQAMQTDARIKQAETNRKVKVVEKEGLPWTLGRSWA